MGSKGSNTTTTTYTPNAAVGAAGNQALSLAQYAASQPFQAPLQQVAPFVGDQNQAFGQYRNIQGTSQPYFNAAANYAAGSAAPITGQDVAGYLNPYAQFTLGNLAETQGQQMADITGRLRQQAGGVGADRIAVGQSELARQQNLATGQTLANIYQPALQAAQQQKQMMAGAGNAFANYGLGSLNANLQETGALNASGNQQQGLNQAQLDAMYRHELARIAYPYQNAQFLANTAGSLSGAMGGTTSKTGPSPSMFSQLLGGATAAAGMAGQMGAFGTDGWANPNNWGTGAYGSTPYQNNSWVQAGQGYGPWAAMAEGGAVKAPDMMSANPYIPMSGWVQSKSGAPQVAEEKSGGSGGGIGEIITTAAKFLPMFLNRGGRVSPYDAFRKAYASGGGIGKPGSNQSASDWDDATVQPFAYTPPMEPGARIASGFPAEDEEMTPFNPNFIASRFPTEAEYMTPYDPDVVPDPGLQQVDAAAIDDWRSGVDRDMAGGSDEGIDGKSVAYGAPASEPQGTGLPEAVTDFSAQSRDGIPYPDLDLTNDTSRRWDRSPWMALINAGAAMMAGDSPFAGVNIGKGLQAGSKTLTDQRKSLASEEGINARARALIQQAKQHNDQYTKMTAYQRAQLEQQRLTAARQERLDRISQQRADAYLRSVQAQEKRAEAAAAAAEKASKKPNVNEAAKYRSELKAVDAIESTARGAAEVIAKLDRADQLAKEAYTAPIIGSIAKSFDKETAELNSIYNDISLTGTAKLKGAVSDFEQRIVRDLSGNVNMTGPAGEGARQAVRAANQRAVEYGQFMRDWFEQHQTTYGAEKAWNKYIKDNPLFGKDKKLRPPGDPSPYLDPQYTGKGPETIPVGTEKSFKDAKDKTVIGVWDGSKWVPK